MKTLALLLCLTSICANATTLDLLISLNKTKRSYEIKNALKNLEKKDLSMGTCYLESRVSDYIEFDVQAPYYGVAIVSVSYKCNKNLEAYINDISTSVIDYYGDIKNIQFPTVNADFLYKIYSNPKIDPKPSVSGSN